ncbi:MFS transporter [Parahaliea mediterranea]|uniref:MFS transporter n=1 Tax=Parahaliea mediterranea TaxID=651086 RepID=A0A939DHB0_9GAMM|nr:MFS transporter [Parahaliea mediterranea]
MPEPSGRAREIWAWACYDLANSGYTTVVLTTIYSAYFVAVVAGALPGGVGTLLWTVAVAIANGCVLISAPVVGAVADHLACKKCFLLISTIACVLSTAALAVVGPGQVLPAMLLVTLSAIAFASGENLIAAFLPEIATRDRMGRVSGYGWGLGYVGGLLTLGACLGYIAWARGRGYDAPHYVPVTLLLTATVFALAAAPTFIWLRERARPRHLPGRAAYIRIGLQRVRDTLAHAARLPDLFRFLGCLVLFQSGVATVVVIAAIYAQQVMGFDSQQLIVLVMVVNLTAAIGAFGFGFAQDRFGSVPSLAVALLVWVAAIGVTWFARTPAEVWLAGNLMGLAMGATQAGGRALIGRFTPESRSAEFFGLWGLANRTAAIIGPLSYGAISGLSGGNHRLALLSTLCFFVAGLILLFSVNEARGEAAAGGR